MYFLCRGISRAPVVRAPLHIGAPLAVVAAACVHASPPPLLPCKPSAYAHTHTLGGTRMPVHRRYRYPSPAIASVFLALLCVTRIIRSLAAARRRVPGAADLDKSKIAVAEVSWRVPHPRRPPFPRAARGPKGMPKRTTRSESIDSVTLHLYYIDGNYNILMLIKCPH